MFKPVHNPPQRFSAQTIEWLDVPPEAALQIFEEEARSIITENKSPDIPFRYSLNPYRGCFHACAYCYARPTHQYLDFGAGSDFERKIVVKINAPQRLEQEFNRASWSGDGLVFSGITDCYQPLEYTYELTRKCLEVCARFRNPVSIITKGALVTRDIDVLKSLTENAAATVYFSIPFLDDGVSKLIEPGAPRSSRRFRAMKELSDAGIRTGLSISPLVPGLNEQDIPALLERAADAGAQSAFLTLLRLPAEVKDVFIERVSESFPSRAKKILSSIQAYRGGKLNDAEWGKRMSGEGERWKAAEWLFKASCKRVGLNQRNREKSKELAKTFRRPTPQLQFPFFE